MIGKLAVLAAGGLLALSIGVANAQQPQPGAADQDKCWDVASKSIKTKAEVTGTTSQSGSAGGSATQGAASGSASGGMQSSGSASGSAALDRPAAAQGLPTC